MKLERLLRTLILTLFISIIPLSNFATTINHGDASASKQLNILESSFNGKIGLYAIDTTNNHEFHHHSLNKFPFQSTFKVIVVANILKQSVTNTKLLSKRVTYNNDDLTTWSPITKNNVRTGMTISELCSAAIMYSDNTAVNLLIRELGSTATVAQFARSIGNHSFHLVNIEPQLNSNPNNSDDTSTPQEMGESLKKLTLGNSLPAQQKEILIDWMKRNTTGNAKIRAGTPKDWIVADKTGSGSFGVSNDMAVIFPKKGAPIILAIYTIQNKQEALPRDDIIVAATKIILNHFRKYEVNELEI